MINIQKIKTWQIILLLGLLMLFTPLFFTLPVVSKWLAFNNTGQIGDTIGGITSPFINGLGALLVFISFRAQIEANSLTKEQISIQNIREDISALESNYLREANRLEREIEEELRRFGEHGQRHETKGIKTFYWQLNPTAFNRVRYIHRSFLHLLARIEQLKTEQEVLTERLKIVYLAYYQTHLQTIVSLIKQPQTELDTEYVREKLLKEPCIVTLLQNIDELETRLGE